MSLTKRKTLPQNERFRLIVEGLWSGKKVGDRDKPGTIAYECGVRRRTILRDKLSVAYNQMSSIFLEQYLQELRNLENVLGEDGAPKYKALAIQEKGRLVRAMIPRRIEAKAEIRQIIIQPKFNKMLEAKFVVNEDESTEDST